MGKKKSLLKTSLFTVGLLEVVNRIIDSASIANKNTKPAVPIITGNTVIFTIEPSAKKTILRCC